MKRSPLEFSHPDEVLFHDFSSDTLQDSEKLYEEQIAAKMEEIYSEMDRVFKKMAPHEYLIGFGDRKDQVVASFTDTVAMLRVLEECGCLDAFYTVDTEEGYSATHQGWKIEVPYARSKRDLGLFTITENKVRQTDDTHKLVFQVKFSRPKPGHVFPKWYGTPNA